MLTAEVKINDKVIAKITAIRGETISDRPGDFIGDRATVCKYNCVVENVGYTFMPKDEFVIVHDRRFGWAGLLSKIAQRVTDPVIETHSEADRV